jgi:hypothetical protein
LGNCLRKAKANAKAKGRGKEEKRIPRGYDIKKSKDEDRDGSRFSGE